MEILRFDSDYMEGRIRDSRRLSEINFEKHSIRL